MSWVSAFGRLNITRNFGPHRRIPGIKIPYVCIEAATVALWNVVHGGLTGSGCLSGTLRYMYMYIGTAATIAIPCRRRDIRCLSFPGLWVDKAYKSSCTTFSHAIAYDHTPSYLASRIGATPPWTWPLFWDPAFIFLRQYWRTPSFQTRLAFIWGNVPSSNLLFCGYEVIIV